jgi:hypothetical protein
MSTQSDDRHLLPLRPGENLALEKEAAEWLAKSRRGVTALSEKRDWLSHDQLQLRYQREIMNHTGICDESLMSGMFRREYNPLAGSRPTRRTVYDE